MKPEAKKSKRSYCANARQRCVDLKNKRKVQYVNIRKICDVVQSPKGVDMVFPVIRDYIGNNFLYKNTFFLLSCS